MKKKGFTLIELLAVIVILGLISVITVPIVMNEINKSKEESFEIGVQNTIESARTYVIENYSENDFPEGGIDVTSGLLKLKNNKYISGIIKKDEKGIIIVENISDGTYCSNGSRNELETIKGDCSKNDETAPDVKVKLRESKSNSLIYSVTMSDSGSGIKEYKYCYQSCNNEKNWKTKTYEEPYPKKEIKESIILKGLAQNKKYTIKVKVVNGNGLEKEVKNEKGITKEIEEAKFKVSSSSYSGKKEVTIIYPEYQEGYEYSYEYNGEKVTLESGKNEIKFEVTKTGTVTAKIEYEENGEREEIVSKLNIVNIDKEGPNNVEVTVPSGWSKTKTVTIKATDEGSGLAYKAYQFDGGEWTNTNKKVYTENARIKIKVRDKLGNETSEFNNGQTELVLNKVDTESATCSISVEGDYIKFEGQKWYTEQPTITVTYKDYYIDADGKRVEGGSGVKETSTMTLTTGTTITEKTVTISGNKYTTSLGDGKHIITFNAEDYAGNTETTCSKTIYVDSVKPVIKAKEEEYVVKYEKDIDLLSTYFTITKSYGPAGGTIKCYTMLPKNETEEKTNNNQLKLGINKIKCEIKGNNGKTSEFAETTIKHKIKGDIKYSCSSGTLSGSKCITTTNGKTGCSKWKCKTLVEEENEICGCKTETNIIKSCTEDNDSTTTSEDTNKTPNSLCVPQSGKVETSINTTKNTVTITWYDFKRLYFSKNCYAVEDGNGLTASRIQIGTEKDTISCSSSKGYDHSENEKYIGKFGNEEGASDAVTKSTWICYDLDTKAKKNKYTNKFSSSMCESGTCGFRIKITISANRLKADVRNYITLGAGTWLEAYHSICTPTFEEKCTKYNTCNVCKEEYPSTSPLKDKYCETYTYGNITTEVDATVTYYKNGTNVSTGKPISATCNGSTCTF